MNYDPIEQQVKTSTLVLMAFAVGILAGVLLTYDVPAAESPQSVPVTYVYNA